MSVPPATKERLAAMLTAEGLQSLAYRAAGGEFDDRESEHLFPAVRLLRELHDAGRDDLAQRAAAGEWAPSLEESEAWCPREGTDPSRGRSS